MGDDQKSSRYALVFYVFLFPCQLKGQIDCHALVTEGWRFGLGRRYPRALVLIFTSTLFWHALQKHSFGTPGGTQKILLSSLSQQIQLQYFHQKPTRYVYRLRFIQMDLLQANYKRFDACKFICLIKSSTCHKYVCIADGCLWKPIIIS